MDKKTDIVVETVGTPQLTPELLKLLLEQLDKHVREKRSDLLPLYKK